MRAHLFLLPLVLAGCGEAISQHEILRRSKVEIARRETWAPTAAIIIQNPDEVSRFNWKVRAGAFDFSDYPHYKGIRFVPGTERELRFTPDGNLTRYTDPTKRSMTPVPAGPTDMLMAPEN